jgi:tetratricopeptide (TPR) repeat protein
MSEPVARKQIKIACSSCGQHLDVTDLPAFSRALCPACNTKLLVPMVIGSYQLLSPVGSGGMGTVYKAFDTTLQRFVAVKLMKKELAANKEFVADFTREARAAAALNHPNIAQILSFGQTSETDGQYYIVMELLEGGSLDHLIETHKRVPELDVLNIGIQVASALKAAYQRGVIHRDIKPGNILFNAESQAKVVDFGLAQFAGAEEEKKQEDGIWGTPYYIAPEKLSGEREDFRSDIYSLGGTLFHALAGRAPFEANSATEVVLKHLREPALSLKTFAPDICDETAQTIGQMLRKNREERYGSYEELIDDLEEAKRAIATRRQELAEQKRGPRAGAGSAKAAKPGGSWKGVVVTLVLLAVCIAGGVVFWVKRDKIFGGGETAPTAGATAPQAAAPDVAQNWLDIWDTADSRLNAGDYQNAIAGYLKAREKLPNDPRQTVLDCQIGAALYLLGKPGDARKSFSAAGEKTDLGVLPEKITRDNFAAVLGQLIGGGLQPKETLPVLKQQIPPAWILAQFYLGARALGEGQWADAAKFFDSYVAAKTDAEPRWVLLYQPHAQSIARQIHLLTKGLAEARQLNADRKAGEAGKKIKDLKTQVTHPLLQSQFPAVDAAIAATAKDLQNEADAQHTREQFAQDKQSLEQVDSTVAAALNECDFDALAKAYTDAAEKMGSPDVKQIAQDRAMIYQRLATLKAQVIAGVAQSPYVRNDLTTRTNVRLVGKVAKADATRIVFAQERAEQPVAWHDLAPASILTLLVAYDTTANAQQSAVRGANLVAVAWLSQFYHFDQFTETYVNMAVKLTPVSRNEWDRFNTPLAGMAAATTTSASGKKTSTDVDFEPVKKKKPGN